MNNNNRPPPNYIPNPYRPPSMPPRPGQQNQQQYQNHQQVQNHQVIIDQSTLERFKALEINKASLETKYEHKVRNLEKDMEELQLQLAMKESVSSANERQINLLSQALAKEQSERVQDRLQWSQEVQRLVDQRPSRGSSPDDQKQISQLLNQLQVERQNNVAFSKYLEQINEKHQYNLDELRLAHDEEKAKLEHQLEDERKANELLDKSLRVLKTQLDDICSSTPFVAPQIGDILITPEEHEALKETLRQERYSFEQSLAKKQLELTRIQVELEKKSRPDQTLHERHSDLKLKHADLQEHLISLQEQLDNTAYQLSECQRLVEAFQAREAVTFTPNDSPSLTVPPKLPKDYPVELFELFTKAGDTANTGKLDCQQLQVTLSRCAWPDLSLKTASHLARLCGNDSEHCNLQGFKMIYEWVDLLKATFAKYDANRISETVWGYVVVDPASFKDVLLDLGLVFHQKAVQTLIKRLSLEGVTLSWDMFVFNCTVLKVFDYEFKKLDLDNDNAITIYHQVFMITVAKCIP